MDEPRSEVAGNEGIVIGGNAHVEAEQMVAGRNARVTLEIASAEEPLTQAGLDEIRDRLNQLMEAISREGEALDNKDEVLDSAERVVDELAREKPNKLMLSAVLDGIASSVKTATLIATSAHELKAAVQSLL